MTRQLDSEWDDTSRDLAEGLERHDQEVCPGCGLHKSIHADPERAFTFEDQYCTVCRGQAIWARVVADADQKEAEQLEGRPPSEPRSSDGRHTYLRGMTRDEATARKAKREGRVDGRTPRER